MTLTFISEVISIQALEWLSSLGRLGILNESVKPRKFASCIS